MGHGTQGLRFMGHGEQEEGGNLVVPVSLSNSDVQRHSALAVTDVGPSFLAQQLSDHVHEAFLCGEMERRLAVRVPGGWVGCPRQERVDNREDLWTARVEW